MDIWLYLQALWSYWWALMSCAVFTLLGAFVLYFRKSETWALWATFGAAIALLFVASFLAWRDQKELVDEAIIANQNLQKKIDDSTVSKFSGSIDFAILGAQSNGSHAALVVSLNNSGAPSAVDPGSWQLSVAVNGHIYEGSPNTLLHKNLDFCFAGTSVRRFVRNDSLSRKASAPIPMNGFVQGLLWFAIPNLNAVDLNNPSTDLALSAKSISGQSFKILTTVDDLKQKSTQTKFMDGIENPRPIPMRCKENSPY